MFGNLLLLEIHSVEQPGGHLRLEFDVIVFTCHENVLKRDRAQVITGEWVASNRNGAIEKKITKLTISRIIHIFNY
jgi:hypothetical protein